MGGDWYDVLPMPGGGGGARDGRRGGQGAGRRLDGGTAAQRAARLRARGPPAGARGRAAQPPDLDRGRGQPDGHAALSWSWTRRRADCAGSTPATSPPLLRGGRADAALPRGRQLGAARRAAVPGLRGGRRCRWSRARRWCSTPTAWSSGPASTSTSASAAWPTLVRDAPDRPAAALRSPAARARARRRRGRRRGAAGPAHAADGRIASGSSSRPSPSRSPRCARCCGAGCVTPRAASRRSPR